MTLEIEVLIFTALTNWTGGGIGGDIIVFFIVAAGLAGIVFALRMPPFLIPFFSVALGLTVGWLYPPFYRLMVLYIGWTVGIYILRKFNAL